MDGIPTSSIETELRARPIRELRAGLKRLGYPVAHCVERNDFISALLQATTCQIRDALGKTNSSDSADGQAELLRQLLIERPETALPREAAEDRLPSGSLVRLCNLQSAPALNTQRAVVVRYDSLSDRYEVRLEWDGSIKKIRWENLDIQETASPPSPLASKGSAGSPCIPEAEFEDAEVRARSPHSFSVENPASPSPSRSLVEAQLHAITSPNTRNVTIGSTSSATSTGDTSQSIDGRTATSNVDSPATIGASEVGNKLQMRAEIDMNSSLDVLPGLVDSSPAMEVSGSNESHVGIHGNDSSSATEDTFHRDVRVHTDTDFTRDSDILPSIAEVGFEKESSVEDEQTCSLDLASEIGELLIAASVLDEPVFTPQKPDRPSEDVKNSHEDLLSASGAPLVTEHVGAAVLRTPTAGTRTEAMQDDADGKAESYCSSPRSSADLSAVRIDSSAVDMAAPAGEIEASKAEPLIFKMKSEEKTAGKACASKKALRIRVAYDAGKQSGENTVISYLSEGLRQLWKDGDLCDVTLLCRGSSFRVHRLVLAAHSKELKDFVAEASEVQMSWLMFPESLKLMLDFLYEEATIWSYSPSCHDVNMEVMQLAHKFQLPRLMHRAAAIMAQSLSTHNVVQSLHDCDTFRLGDLKDRILSYLATNKKALAEITTGSSISSHPDLLREILVRVATPKDDGSRKRARLST
mmetsp:Transcript_64940/g.101304  ORF Transcript_64940/g.101304 Transcript_64940/m.101304 type:complete len:696 (+) Transcript_64940:122-2209(+)